MLPEYVNEYLQAYFQVSSEDRRKLLDMRYFDTDPLTCPAAYLPYLAIEVGVTLDGLSEKEARQSIANAIATLNQKGTLKSLKVALAPFSNVSLKEWFAYGAKPYHFKAILEPNRIDFAFDKEHFTFLRHLILRNKNVRSHLDGFEIALRVRGDMKLYGAYGARAKIERDARIDTKPHTSANLASAQAFRARIAKSAEYAKNIQTPIHLGQGKIVRTSMTKEAEVAMSISTRNTVQGAAIWRV